MPFCRPEPLTSTIDRDGKPRSSSSMRIGSNASWRTNASTFFIALLAPPRSRCVPNATAPGPGRKRDSVVLALGELSLARGDLAVVLGLGPHALRDLPRAMGVLDRLADLLGRLGVALVLLGG